MNADIINKEKLKVLILIAILYIVFYIVGIGSPIRFLTGISCAGCGMTRAFISLLHLKFIESFYYHPLWWLVIVDTTFYLYEKKLLEKNDFSFSKKYEMLLFVSIILFMVVYIFRMFDPKDDIVTFNIQNGIVYRLYRFLF